MPDIFTAYYFPYEETGNAQNYQRLSDPDFFHREIRIIKENLTRHGFTGIEDEAGNIIGFEFRFVPKYYKGLWFTQCRFGNVTVDEEEFDRDDLIFRYDGMEYSREEMFDLKKYWQFRTPLTIKILKKDGLSIGYHNVQMEFGWVLNYNGALEAEFDGNGLGNSQVFGTHHERKMLLAR